MQHVRLRSNIASQIHIAGRICTSVSRQFVRRAAWSPSNSITRGADRERQRGEHAPRPLRRRTVASTFASSLSWIARTSVRIRSESDAEAWATLATRPIGG